MVLFLVTILVSNGLLYKIIKDQQEMIYVYKHTQEVHQASTWEAEVKLNQSIHVFVVIALVFVTIGSGLWFVKRLVNMSLRSRIKSAQDHLRDLSQGDLREGLPRTGDEFDSLYASINLLTERLTQLKVFAEEVGSGTFDSKIDVFNNSGAIGKSLAHMRHSLMEVASKDQVRNWTSEGIAKFSQLLRKHDHSLDLLCNELIKELVKYLHANQGALFISRDEDGQTLLDMKACYAYGRRKYLENTIHPGQGLAGQAFVEGETIYLTEIPDNYFNITSGLGDATPRSLLIVPLKLNEVLVGVIEMASLKLFRPQDIAFVEKISESIASTLHGAQIAEKTQELLHSSVTNAEQLRAQEEELRQNLEEMQATQEQFQRQAEVMKAIQEKLMLEKSMFKVLMEYLPDRLTYKDTESKVIRVNKAKAKRFNLDPDQMVGTSDFDFFPAAHAQKARDEEVLLMKEGKAMLDIQEKVTFEDGNVMFINTSRIPFRNEANELLGVFIISKDITQQKLQEATIERHNQIFKALLNLIPAFSYKVNKDGVIEDLYLGHVNRDLEALQNTTIQQLLPEFY
ncbi:MAG TPA: GAF domain-containing protein, partial [Cytophagales bacterium]|nr:GAF domain-containing protein [Cytophagales bacterium]